MARQESDREDLLREATAFLQRIEWRVEGPDEFWFCGFRANGAASFYFGPNFVVHFNSDREVRRGYVSGRLITAEEGALRWLDRERGATQTLLRNTALTDGEQAAFLKQATDALTRLRDLLQTVALKARGVVPEDANVADRVKVWLETLPVPLVIANGPGVGAKA